MRFHSTFRSHLVLSAILTSLFVSASGTDRQAAAADPFPVEIERQFQDDVLPFLKSNCFDCHSPTRQEGKLNLATDSTVAAVVKNHRVWETVVERLVAGEMPPSDAPIQPTAKARQLVINWAKTVRDLEAERHAGDPGVVLARRLSNAEFDNTIRDLIGADIRPTREFPVDPANESGFDNSGESLTMSPALVKKYLTAARFVADHAVFTPNGFAFASHPVVTETDRDKYCVQQIVDFYQRHDVDLADYFVAAWLFQNRAPIGQPEVSLNDLARITKPSRSETRRSRSSLSEKYLAVVWAALSEPETTGPMAVVQAEWKKLIDDAELLNRVKSESPAGTSLHRECAKLRDQVLALRKGLDKKVEKLHVKGNSDGSQPLILWWNRQIAAQRMTYVGDGKDETLDAARSRFCRVFPNAYSVSSRGHYADEKLGAEVRLLTAGFHLMQGYFRDDQPLCELVLTESEKSEIDSLWQNLNFITLVPYRQYKDFLFFERAEPPRFAGGPEFDFARPENKDVTSQDKLIRMREAYVAKAGRNEASPEAISAIEAYFKNMSTDIRWIEQAQIDAVPRHLESLAKFAERAYRRPLETGEREELLAFYRHLRDTDGLNHEDAVRDSIASILLSPHFCFRFDLALPGQTVSSLTDYELASRLSYFLWSSMPDDELLRSAAQGRLHEPEELVTQTRRMFQDPRVRGLATEFAGNWLEFRRFEEHNSVDRERFASFTNELRQSMYEEPIRFFMSVAREDRSVLEFLDADYTFVNPTLARHYGIDLDSVPSQDQGELVDGWRRVQNVRSIGRGGLPTMSVFLTKNSPGLRTSPVKRGYWVVRRLLGERIPAPPPDVPELPKDEATLGELSLPQLLARHRDHKACAGCHQRFDSIGLTFEGFGPIGDRREKDLGGRPVETKAVFPDGTEGNGIEGLRRYLLDQRREDFVDNLCRKLLSYALGRSLIPSDKSTIDQMRSKLESNRYRFDVMAETIVTSPQFLKKRGIDIDTP